MEKRKNTRNTSSMEKLKQSKLTDKEKHSEKNDTVSKTENNNSSNSVGGVGSVLLPKKSTNWFTSLIIPSARAIASGAGKIVSAFISDDEDDSVSEEDDSNDDEYENQYNQEIQLGVQRTDTKHLIEQLILQETFSREEFDSLVKVLNSRVTGQPIGAADGSPKSDDHGNSDQYNKALLEAKKWFEDNKVGSSSRTELVQSNFNTKSTGLQLVCNTDKPITIVAPSPKPNKKKRELDPVEMSKRPPWLPDNWIMEVKVRTSGSTAGLIDRYYYEPENGSKFRSKVEVMKFLETGTVLKGKNV